MEEAVFTDEKQVREENMKNVTARLEEALQLLKDEIEINGEVISLK